MQRKLVSEQLYKLLVGREFKGYILQDIREKRLRGSKLFTLIYAVEYYSEATLTQTLWRMAKYLVKCGTRSITEAEIH